MVWTQVQVRTTMENGIQFISDYQIMKTVQNPSGIFDREKIK